MKSLKYIRIVAAVIIFAAVVFLFIDAYGYAAGHLDFVAKIQLVPALLSLNLAAILLLLFLTLIFGRVYCSVICPLGVYQDFVARIRKLFAGKKKRKVGVYKYKKASTRLRVIFLGLFVAVFLLSLLNVMALSIGALIEPYSAFGRMVTAFVSPVYEAANNYLAEGSAQVGDFDYSFVSRSVPLVLLIVAALTFIVVSVLAFTGGRKYCNTVCPVGTVLGYLSKFSWLKIRINKAECNRCGSCQRHCKATCIDSKNHDIDYTRCVDCFDCLNVCSKNAIYYGPQRRESVETENTADGNKGRRRFLATVSVITGVIAAEAAGEVVDKITDGGLTPLKSRPATDRKTGILPPGAQSQAHMNSHCVGCQLCIQACPQGILEMSTELSTFMQPVMTYRNNYCLPECNRCSQVCPAGVFLPLNSPQKSSLKIGTAVVNYSECISANGIDSCGNCGRHCPAGAIVMEDNGEATVPVVNENICIGCGACEVHCPVGTVQSMTADRPAIHVEGVTVQRFI